MSKEDFLGTKRELTSGASLKIVGIEESFNSKGGWKGVYIAECTICSKDAELWPYGSIRITKGHFKEGNIPCGCSPPVRYSVPQLRVILNRHCKQHKLTLISDDFKNKQSKVELMREDGSTFSTKIVYLLKSSTGDYTTKGKYLSPAITHIEDFNKTGRFHKSTLFIRTENHRVWKVICPVCSVDTFVENGLCSGIFTSKIDNLKMGKVPCRCSGQKPMTEEQALFSVREGLKKEGYHLYKWGGWEKAGKSKFKWVCKEGHIQETSYTNYFNNGTRCASCIVLQQQMEGYGYGYYPHKDEEKDYLYITEVVGNNGTVFKIGRSFNYEEREKDLRKQYKVHFYLTRLYTGKHKDVFKEEGRLHKLFKGRKYKLGNAREFFRISADEVKRLKVNLEEVVKED